MAFVWEPSLEFRDQSWLYRSLFVKINVGFTQIEGQFAHLVEILRCLRFTTTVHHSFSLK